MKQIYPETSSFPSLLHLLPSYIPLLSKESQHFIAKNSEHKRIEKEALFPLNNLSLCNDEQIKHAAMLHNKEIVNASLKQKESNFELIHCNSFSLPKTLQGGIFISILPGKKTFLVATQHRVSIVCESEKNIWKDQNKKILHISEERLQFEHRFLILAQGLVLFLTFEGAELISFQEIELDYSSSQFTRCSFSHLASDGALLCHPGGVKFYDCRTKGCLSLLQCGNAQNSSSLFEIDSQAPLAQYERISAIHSPDLLKFTVISNTHLSFFDSRYLRKPMSRQSHSLLDCPPSQILQTDDYSRMLAFSLKQTPLIMNIPLMKHHLKKLEPKFSQFLEGSYQNLIDSELDSFRIFKDQTAIQYTETTQCKNAGIGIRGVAGIELKNQKLVVVTLDSLGNLMQLSESKEEQRVWRYADIKREQLKRKNEDQENITYLEGRQVLEELVERREEEKEEEW